MASFRIWFSVLFASPVLSLTHLVCVGCFELEFTAKFTPPSLTAAVGDFVEFQWPNGDAMAHSVTRGSYNGFPCQPAIDGMDEQEGREKAVSSGFIDRFGWEDNTWTVQINDTNPLWYYDCSSCSVRMAGVINPPGNPLDGNITEWQAAAVFSFRDVTELERCTLGEQGGRFAHLSIEEMWDPENENATKTVENSEGAVEKEKARRASLSSEVAETVPTPSSTASLGSSATSANASSGTPSTTSETASSRPESSNTSSTASLGSSATSANASSGTPSTTSETASSRPAPSTTLSSASPNPSTSINAACKLGGEEDMMALMAAIGGVMWYGWM